MDNGLQICVCEVRSSANVLLALVAFVGLEQFKIYKMSRYIPPSYRKARKEVSELKKCKGCINNNSVFELSDYHSGCSICGKLNFYHPIPVGTETKHGKITSYKLVRFGIGKYRYFINDEYYTEEQIESALAGN